MPRLDGLQIHLSLPTLVNQLFTHMEKVTFSQQIQIKSFLLTTLMVAQENRRVSSNKFTTQL